MKNGVWVFQLYLLSVMRTHPDVLTHSLKRLQASPQDMNEARDEVLTFGFGELVFPVKLYIELLGPPFRIAPVDDQVTPEPFRGSLRLHFRLPLWDGFDFIVHENAAGFPWNVMFQRFFFANTPPLLSEADLKPWKFTKSEVTNAFGNPVFLESWDNWEELNYLIPPYPNVKPVERLAVFDYGLFQYLIVDGEIQKEVVAAD
jgi:hypothetical protein